MTKNRFLPIVSGVSLLVGVIIAFFVFQAKDTVLGLAPSQFTSYAGDVVGSHTGTSTTGIAFETAAGASAGVSATSSYVSRIGGAKTLAVYTVKALSASTTANLAMEVSGSNDDYCWTTNTSGAVDLPKVSDINWYSAGDHMLGSTGATALVNASSTKTILWTNPSNTTGNEIVLSNLNFECLRFNVSGSSTIAFVQLRTK